MITQQVLHDLADLPDVVGWETPCYFPPATMRAEDDDDLRSNLLQRIFSPANVESAWEHVATNQGCAGADGITITQLQTKDAFSKAWRIAERQILGATYQPVPLLCVDIPKTDGGSRTLSIPTVLDRVVLQSIAQQLAPSWESRFSDCSFAYRPGRGAHDALRWAQAAMNRGNRWVVDLDIEKYFDRVPHHRLLAILQEDLEDSDPVIQLIDRFLKTPRLDHHRLRSAQGIGLPQGSPLSPLLANIYLDQLDQFLEQNGCEFARYADDFVILVISEQRGMEVREAVETFLQQKLGLSLNREKSQIVPPGAVKFLGFTFREDKRGKVRRIVHPKSLEVFHEKVDRLLGNTVEPKHQPDFAALANYVNGWRRYYQFTQQPGGLAEEKRWVCEAVRKSWWRTWKTPKQREAELIRHGIDPSIAEKTSQLDNAEWLPVLRQALPDGRVWRGVLRQTASWKKPAPSPSSTSAKIENVKSIKKKEVVTKNQAQSWFHITLRLGKRMRLELKL